MKPSGRDRDRAATALAAAPPAACADGQVGDRRAESLGDAGDGARVGVEGFGVGQSLAHSVGQRGADGIGDQLEDGH